MEYMEYMGKLKQLRKEKHISQIRLSIEIGVAQETISAYERGKALPTLENLKKLPFILILLQIIYLVLQI